MAKKSGSSESSIFNWLFGNSYCCGDRGKSENNSDGRKLSFSYRGSKFEIGMEEKIPSIEIDGELQPGLKFTAPFSLTTTGSSLDKGEYEGEIFDS